MKAGTVAAIRFTINGIYRGREVITLEHVNRIGLDAAPDWPAGSRDDVYRVDIVGSPSISQETAFRFTDGSGRTPAVAGCLATGMRALNAVPAVNDLPPGWVTALDLPLIPGVGTIRRSHPRARPHPGVSAHSAISAVVSSTNWELSRDAPQPTCASVRIRSTICG